MSMFYLSHNSNKFNHLKITLYKKFKTPHNSIKNTFNIINYKIYSIYTNYKESNSTNINKRNASIVLDKTGELL